jgi:hypothetical protein
MYQLTNHFSLDKSSDVESRSVSEDSAQRKTRNDRDGLGNITKRNLNHKKARMQG